MKPPEASMTRLQRLLRAHSRLRWLQLKRLVAAGRGEPVIWLAVLALPIALVALGAHLGDRAQGLTPRVVLDVAGLAAAAAFGSLHQVASRRSQLAFGPLGHLATSAGMRAAPPLLDAGLLWILGFMPILFGALAFAPSGAVLGGLGAVIGAAVAIVAGVLVMPALETLYRRLRKTSSRRTENGRAFGTWLPPLTRAQWRRASAGAPAWIWAVALLSVGGLIARLARRNAPELPIDMVILTAAIFAAGAMLGRQNGEVLRLLARTPRRLTQLSGLSVGPPLAASAIGGFLAATVAGVPLSSSVFTAVGATTLLGAYLLLCCLHAFSRPRIYRFAASLDMGVAILVGAALPPLAPLWLGTRLVMAAKRAKRLRWRDF